MTRTEEQRSTRVDRPETERNDMYYDNDRAELERQEMRDDLREFGYSPEQITAILNHLNYDIENYGERIAAAIADAGF